MKYYVARVYLVGTVIFPITSPFEESKSICYRFHYENLTG